MQRISLARWVPVLSAAVLLTGLLAGLAARVRAADDSAAKSRAVVVFDFVSKWDEGRYGQMVADGIAKKVQMQNGFAITEMNDVRDICTSNSIKIGPESPLAAVKEATRGTFDADVAIWGSVERAPGTDGEIYDIVLKCVDFTGSAEPRVVYEKSARTNSVAEIPHLYVKEMLDNLFDRLPGGAGSVDETAERAWKENENLVIGGDFESGSRGVPRGWEPRAGQQREPLGNLVKWTNEAGGSKNRVIRMDIPRAVAESEGVMYYSDFFPVMEGAKYRFQCRYRTNGPSPKVFIKCYDEMPSDYKAAGGAHGSTSGGEGALARREVYRSQQNLKGPRNTWNTQTEDFTPKHTKYSPKWGKVMLYGYLSPGVIEWDDVVVKMLIPGSAGQQKVLRHSLDTKVTIDEMKENEKRGQEARDKLGPKKDKKR